MSSIICSLDSALLMSSIFTPGPFFSQLSLGVHCVHDDESSNVEKSSLANYPLNGKLLPQPVIHFLIELLGLGLIQFLPVSRPEPALFGNIILSLTNKYHTAILYFVNTTTTVLLLLLLVLLLLAVLLQLQRKRIKPV